MTVTNLQNLSEKAAGDQNRAKLRDLEMAVKSDLLDRKLNGPDVTTKKMVVEILKGNDKEEETKIRTESLWWFYAEFVLLYCLDIIALWNAIDLIPVGKVWSFIFHFLFPLALTACYLFAMKKLQEARDRLEQFDRAVRLANDKWDYDVPSELRRKLERKVKWAAWVCWIPALIPLCVTLIEGSLLLENGIDGGAFSFIISAVVLVYHIIIVNGSESVGRALKRRKLLKAEKDLKTHKKDHGVIENRICDGTANLLERYERFGTKLMKQTEERYAMRFTETEKMDINNIYAREVFPLEPGEKFPLAPE